MGGADTTQTGENGKLIQEENNDAVTLITLHAAKGLEYPVVFIVGMDEGSLPHSRSVDKPEQLEEERRLAYVGFTRAMRRLYLVRAYRRSFFGESHSTEPSRFLDDIPSSLIANPTTTTSTSTRETGGTRSQTNTRTTQRRSTNWDDDEYNDYNRTRATRAILDEHLVVAKATPLAGIAQQNQAASSLRVGRHVPAHTHRRLCHHQCPREKIYHHGPRRNLTSRRNSSTSLVIGYGTINSVRASFSKARWSRTLSLWKYSSRGRQAKSG